MTHQFSISIFSRSIRYFYGTNLIFSPTILRRRINFKRVAYSKMAENSLDLADLAKEHVHGDRKFYDISSEYAKNKSTEAFKTKRKPDSGKLIEYVAKNVVGKDYVFVGPYGRRKVVYCDYTASGRSLQFIEDYIQNEVLPAYGNTHTTTTITSLQTTLFRHEARDIIRNAVNASEHDAVIFTGNGCTSAIHKLINAMKLDKKPIVFVGPYEHHSNLLPWREISDKVIRIKERADGTVDLVDLENQLQVYKNSNEILIGCFSSASNVTGILCNDEEISILLHKYNALAIWDYACAAPYTKIDMNPVISGPNQSLVYKDAIVISPHKFIGGVGTPGILVAKKSLFRNPVPSNGGGGSVFFVSRQKHRYLKETEMREEGGTPAIVESIRAGLVFQLKENISSQVIMEREEKFTKLAMESWENIPEIILLGSKVVPRLAIFSFLIRNEKTKLFLHHGFVCALLNDLFGIQTRGGCACAGPYSLDLLGIDENMAEEFENVLLEDGRLDRTQLRRYHEYSSNEILRPGFIRLNFPYFMTEERAKFVIDAVKMVAEHGWKLLPQYIFNPETGEWRHHNHQVFKERKWLGSISYLDGEMSYNRQNDDDSKPLPENDQACLEEAQLIFNNALKLPRRINLSEQHLMFSDGASRLKWFLLPSEAHKILSSDDAIFTTQPPFTPKNYNLKTPEININDEISKPTQQHLPKSNKTDKITTNTNQSRWILPPKNIMKPTLKAINEFDMIRNGDKILVCLSGGKDSLSLLHVLHQFQFFAKSKGIDFDLGAVTVDPQSSAYDPSLLKPYLKSLGVCYFYEEQGILDHASTIPELGSICSFCSRLKRGRLYACARREGYNVLAFGQHLDDLSETFLMSAFHNGRLRTMKAHYTVKEGDLRVIRPFVYVREKNTRSFAEKSKLPVISENCPACFEAPKERHRTKQLLAQQEILFPKLFWSLRSTLQPLMAIDRCGIEGETLIRQSLQNLKNEE